MTDKKHAAIVSKSEELAKTRPTCYQRKLRLLVALGNLYLAASVMLLIALQSLSLAILLGATGPDKGLLSVFGVIVLSWAVWALFEPVLMKGKLKPEVGIPLTRKQAPELFALTDAFCRQLKAPRIHRVVITDKFNAGVEQLPRLGLFGWDMRSLVLGLPLMKCMTAEQFKSVLAHELGHLARGQGKTGHRVHQRQLRWTELAEIPNAGPRGFLFAFFLKWFAPYVAACSPPLARMNEYDADTASVRLVSLEAVAEALSASNVIDKYLQEQYWPQVFQLADTQPEPVAPYLMMGRNLAAEVNESWAYFWLAQDMRLQTKPGDSHPVLRDRLKAVEATPRIRLPSPGENAEHLLGSALQMVIERMDKDWQESVRPWWVEWHQHVQSTTTHFSPSHP